MAELSALLSADALAAHLGRDDSVQDDIVIVDATLPPPGTTDFVQPKAYIPGAVEFDLLGLKKLTEAEQTPQLISAMLSELSISHDHHVIIYDRRGLFSAPRMWWVLRTLGHEKLSVLDGGLPAWIATGREVACSPAIPKSSVMYKPKPNPHFSVTHHAVLNAITGGPQIVDARSAGRFIGTAPEPRPGLKSGHIPGSISFPFGSISNDEGILHSRAALAHMIGAAGIDLSRPIITTCGSGVTAAGLAFAFHLLGKDDVSVYSGSWAEWGVENSGLPIEV